MSKSLVLLFTLAAAGAAWAEEVRLTELLRRPAIADVIFDSRSGAIHSFAREAPELMRYPAMRASALLRREVRDRLHRDAGEIVDLVIDLEAKRVARAIIDLRDDWKPGRRVVAVPIETFSLPQDLGDYAVLNIEASAWINEAKACRAISSVRMRLRARRSPPQTAMSTPSRARAPTGRR